MGLRVAVAVVRAVTAAALAVVAVASQAAVQPTSGGILAVWVAAIWVAALERPGPKAVTMAPAWLASLSGPLAVLLIPTVIGRRVANQTTTAIAFTIATTITSGIVFCSRPTRTTVICAITAIRRPTGPATTTAALRLTKDGPVTTRIVSAIDVELLLAADPILLGPAAAFSQSSAIFRTALRQAGGASRELASIVFQEILKATLAN